MATKISLVLNYRMTEHNVYATLLATGYVRDVLWIAEWEYFSRKKIIWQISDNETPDSAQYSV